MQRYAESYLLEAQAFVSAVLQGTMPSPTGTDGRAALQIALAARESLATGLPVSLATP
jgi:predicted dehydrogenase